MGVNASIFARKAKKYVQIDRERNITYPMLDGQKDDLLDKFNGYESEGINNEDLLLVTDIMIRFADRDREEYVIFHSKQMVDFIKTFPDDMFFLENDSGNNDHYYHLMKKNEKYGLYDDSLPKEDLFAYEEWVSPKIGNNHALL